MPDLTFPIKKSLYSNTKCLQNSPGNASLCLIGQRRERVVKYFNEVRKLGKCFKAKNTAFFCANSPSSNELIGYVDLPDFNEIWPKWSSDISA